MGTNHVLKTDSFAFFDNSPFMIFMITEYCKARITVLALLNHCPVLGGGGGATRSLLKDGGYSEQTLQSGHAPRSGPEIKDESILPKMTHRRGSDARQSKRSELDLIVDNRNRCKKNSSILFCIDKRTKERCSRGSEIVTVHSRRGREGSVLPKKP